MFKFYVVRLLVVMSFSYIIVSNTMTNLLKFATTMNNNELLKNTIMTYGNWPH